jgi:hypothetical protein
VLYTKGMKMNSKGHKKEIPMQAKIVPNTVSVIEAYTFEGDGWLVTPCDVVEGWKSPRALRFNGEMYGFRGWNSDLGRAYYCTRQLTAQTV